MSLIDINVIPLKGKKKMKILCVGNGEISEILRVFCENHPSNKSVLIVKLVGSSSILWNKLEDLGLDDMTDLGDQLQDMAMNIGCTISDEVVHPQSSRHHRSHRRGRHPKDHPSRQHGGSYAKCSKRSRKPSNKR